MAKKNTTNVKDFMVRLDKKLDKDLIAILNAAKNKQRFMKNAIRFEAFIEELKRTYAKRQVNQ